MVVDIKLKNVPSYNVASMMRVGPYSRDMLRAEFGQLVNWAKKRKLRTGKWFLYFIDEPDGKRPANKLRSEACLEIKGKPKSEGKVKIKKLPKQRVVSVTFDPGKVSARLVYSGIYGWLRYGRLRTTGPGREVYTSDPWTNPRAWANAEVQVPVKRR
ncbi:MAG TPA: GyrI-like domain-containing protein [Candidatus Hodarchaeales archaeon]|nr:GyrI-like domain-containing protein [Candidatus Hodarchaeales archaeon]